MVDKKNVKCLVISAVNFSEGGPLTVFRDCLAAACELLPDDWEIIALVHDRRLFDFPRVAFMEFQDSKRSWLRRLYYEFWHFKSLSRHLRPDVWLSLHDISPRVLAARQAVYCHNPSPFFRADWRDLQRDPRFFLFTKFYKYLYRINIHANDLVIVQQDWIRKEFRKMYGVDKVAVAYPVGNVSQQVISKGKCARRDVFLYPALPRSFKNFEILCRAAEILSARIGNVFEVRLTVSGGENAHASELVRRYGGSPVLKFIGLQDASQMARQYQEATTVVFPSLLETWGLPISEAKACGKDLLLADLPYAHEALGGYDRAAFFDPHDASGLATLMQNALGGKQVFGSHKAHDVAAPFAPNWVSLLQLVVYG